MIVTVNEGNSHAIVIDDDQHEHELSEQLQGTSPTPRSAAYHTEIDLGRSQAFVEMMKEVDLVSGTDSPVLLTGERGAAREFVAAAIHHRSGRSGRPFVVIDCAAIPAELIEQKLFGREGRGGLLEEIDGGTVFLDELTQTSPSVQLKLLRVLQTGETSRMGSSETQRVNVRVIAASSCGFEEEVAAGRFSSDLFKTLNAVSIAMPTLEDHHENSSPEPVAQAEPAANNDWVTLSEIEGRYVARVLEHTRGNKQAAARVLAVDRKTLDRMIKRHNIDCQQARALRAKASARISS